MCGLKSFKFLIAFQQESPLGKKRKKEKKKNKENEKKKREAVRDTNMFSNNSTAFLRFIPVKKAHRISRASRASQLPHHFIPAPLNQASILSEKLNYSIGTGKMQCYQPLFLRHRIKKNSNRLGEQFVSHCRMASIITNGM